MFPLLLGDEQHCCASGEVIIKMIDPQLLEFAKTMRSNFEHLMWKILRAKRFTSIKFVYKINIFHLKIVIYLEY